MAFILGSGTIHRALHVGRRQGIERRRRRVPVAMCAMREGADALHSPGAVARAWEAARSAACATDIARRYVNVLFVSEHCHRALIAERAFTMLAERRSRARRLLVHSAGLDATPGATVPRDVLAVAAQRGLFLADSQPCARFDTEDFEYYDFILVMDRAVRERLARIAQVAARNSGGNLSDWERKIRLVADFDGERMTGRMSVGVPVDIPRFPKDGELNIVVDHIHDACERVLDVLIAAGL